MSDLTATNCNSCDNGGNGCGCWWIIILLLLCGGCGNSYGNGCGNNGSFFNMGNNGDNGCGCGCWWIIILLLLCGCCN